MTTPFSTATASAPGADPGSVQSWRTDTPKCWLGRPEYSAGLIQLPKVSSDGYSATGSRGQVLHGLLDGGEAMTEWESLMRTWTLPFRRLAARDWSIINGFDRHLFGADPLIFVNPEDINAYTLRESMCGGLAPTDPTLRGWVSNGNTPTYATGIAPFVYPGGVMQWSPAASGRILHNGSTYGVVDYNHAAPYLPALPTCVSFYVRTVSGTASVQARVSGRDVSSNVVTEVTGTSVPLTTAWTQVSATAVANSLTTSDYLLGELVSSSASVLLVCCPQLEYNSTPSPWNAGSGSARVMITSPLNRTPDAHWNSAATLTLTECITGAA